MGDTYACTAHAVTWELQRQIINGNAEAKFNMGDMLDEELMVAPL